MGSAFAPLELALEIGRAGESVTALGWPAAGAALAAGVVAWGALDILAWTLGRVRFHTFAWYCFAVSIGGMIAFGVWSA